MLSIMQVRLDMFLWLMSCLFVGFECPDPSNKSSATLLQLIGAPRKNPGKKTHYIKVKKRFACYWEKEVFDPLQPSRNNCFSCSQLGVCSKLTCPQKMFQPLQQGWARPTCYQRLSGENGRTIRKTLIKRLSVTIGLELHARSLLVGWGWSWERWKISPKWHRRSSLSNWRQSGPRSPRTPLIAHCSALKSCRSPCSRVRMYRHVLSLPLNV